MIRSSILFLIGLAVLPGLSQGWFQQLSEARVGNLPYARPGDQFSWYQLVESAATWKQVSLQLGLEWYQKNIPSQRYVHLQHRALHVRWQNFHTVLGHFYTMFGRGLLLRGFQLPGTVLESSQFRTRYGFYRDLDGAMLRFQNSWVQLQGLWARPLDNRFPPTLPRRVRRSDELRGAELRLSAPWGALAGAWLEQRDARGVRKFASLQAEANLPLQGQLYLEWVRRLDDGFAFFSLADEHTHGLYIGGSSSFGPLSLSLEWKEYNNLILGFNDPPPLVREHTFRLVNRSTHVLIPSYEAGWQVELYWRSHPSWQGLINFTQARNRLGTQEPLFKELYSEFTWYPSASTILRVYYDWSDEPLKLERQRQATGLSIEYPAGQFWTVELDVEYQQFQRVLIGETLARNWLLGFVLDRWPGIGFYFTWEASTDPAFTDRPGTLQMERQVRHWLGGGVNWQINSRHSVTLFAGQRRGGTSCTSGICYEVLDFTGVELRLRNRIVFPGIQKK